MVYIPCCYAQLQNDKMLIENKGIKTDNFYIPPFDLNVGEIVVLYLF
ncbi:MAG: hypothetical protein ACJAZG_001993, partial [Granulosicoccus sp.]